MRLDSDLAVFTHTVEVHVDLATASISSLSGLVPRLRRPRDADVRDLLFWAEGVESDVTPCDGHATATRWLLMEVRGGRTKASCRLLKHWPTLGLKLERTISLGPDAVCLADLAVNESSDVCSIAWVVRPLREVDRLDTPSLSSPSPTRRGIDPPVFEGVGLAPRIQPGERVGNTLTWSFPAN